MTIFISLKSRPNCSKVAVITVVVVEIGRGKNGVFVPVVEEDDEIGEENLDFDVSVKEKGRAKKRSASSPSVLVGDIIER